LPDGLAIAGAIRLDQPAAVRAIEPLAATLGTTVEAVALGAVAVAEAAMERALRRVSVEQGHAPWELTLVAFGGAGPLHACGLADALGIPRALVPTSPGALSALGLAVTPQVATASRSVLRPAGVAPPDSETVLRDLEALAREQLGQADDVVLTRTADMRYRGQSWELVVPWRGADTAAAFEAEHERRFGYHRPGAAVELVTLRGAARLRSAATRGGPPAGARLDAARAPERRADPRRPRPAGRARTGRGDRRTGGGDAAGRDDFRGCRLARDRRRLL
jgi:N-methylhydantoinase A